MNLEKIRKMALDRYEKYLDLSLKGVISEETMNHITDDLLEAFGIKKTLSDNKKNVFDNETIKNLGIVALAEVKEDGFFATSAGFGEKPPFYIKIHKGTIVGLETYKNLVPAHPYEDANMVSFYVREGNIFYSIYTSLIYLQNIEKIN